MVQRALGQIRNVYTKYLGVQPGSLHCLCVLKAGQAADDQYLEAPTSILPAHGAKWFRPRDCFDMLRLLVRHHRTDWRDWISKPTRFGPALSSDCFDAYDVARGLLSSPPLLSLAGGTLVVSAGASRHEMKATNQQSNARCLHGLHTCTLGAVALMHALWVHPNQSKQPGLRRKFFGFPSLFFCQRHVNCYRLCLIPKLRTILCTFLLRHAAIQHWPDVSSLEVGVLTNFNRRLTLFQHTVYKPPMDGACVYCAKKGLPFY